MNTTNDNLANPTTWQDTEGDFPNCSDVQVSLKTLYLPITGSVISLVGFLGNIVVIYVSSFKMRPWKSSTVITLNLALTDVLYVTSLPFLVHRYASGEHWIFGEFVCKFIYFGFHFNLQHPLPHLLQHLTLRGGCPPCKVIPLATGSCTQTCYKQKARRLTVLLLVVFCVCFLPVHIFQVAGAELWFCPVSCHMEKQIHSTCIISQMLAALNTWQPMSRLYVMTGGNFQQATLSHSRCKWSKYVQQPGSYNDVTKSETALKL